MRTYNIVKYIIIHAFIALTLIACNSGNKSWQDASSQSSDDILNKICGADGVNSFIIQEVNGSKLVSALNLNQSKNIRSIIQCVNGAKYDVTDLTTLSSSNSSVLKVESKGYITANGVGNAYLLANYDGKYDAKYKFDIINSPLQNISLSIGKTNSKIANGENVPVNIDGKYANNIYMPLSNATITSSNESVVKVVGQNIIGLKSGKSTITVSSGSLVKSSEVEVSSSSVVGIKFASGVQTQFVSGIPQTIEYKAKLVLSDGSTGEIPDSSFDSPTVTKCTLKKLVGDTKIPFVASGGNGCTITSTKDLGENKLAYTYSLLNEDDSVKKTFESSIILKSSDSAIKNVSIDLDSSIKDGAMIVGEVYRYHIYALLSDGSKVDVTKSVPLTAKLDYQNADLSKKIITGDTGYIGSISNPVDDGKGGIIKITDYVIKDDMSNKTVHLSLSASLAKSSDKFEKDIMVIPNVLSVTQLSNLYVNDIFPKLNSDDKKRYKSFSGFNSDGSIAFTDYGHMFTNLKAGQLTIGVLDNNNQTLNFNQVNDDAPIEVALDTTIPRINKLTGSDDPNMTIATIGCNNSNQDQTITTSSVSKGITTTSSVSKSVSVGLNYSYKWTVQYSLFGVGGSTENSVSVNSGYNQTWSDTKSTSYTYTLPAQNVPLKARGKAVVVQQLFKSDIGYTGKFSMPLTDNSCIPFVLNASLLGFAYTSPACTKYNDIVVKPNDSIFGKLFTGDNRLTFFANISGNGVEQASTNTVQVYVYYPGDSGYDSISCNNVALKSASQNNSLKVTSTSNDIKVSNGVLEVGGDKVQLSSKQLVKSQTLSN